jgi:outer membrane protein assembly factor BamB
VYKKPEAWKLLRSTIRDDLADHAEAERVEDNMRAVVQLHRDVESAQHQYEDSKQVCVRAFQAAVACVDTERGAVQWSRTADGQVGLAADDRLLFGVEADGRVQAWRLADGEKAWNNEQLRFRDPSAPLVIGRSVAVGDLQGYVHMLSREDGKVLARLSTDGSAISSRPVLAGNTLVVLTRSGGVFGFVPQ